MRPLPKRRHRGGAILVLAAAAMLMMIAFLAMALDLGYMMLVRTQLQSAADSAAMAGAWDLWKSRFSEPSPTPAATTEEVCTTARTYAGVNWAAGYASTLADGDITVGRLDLSAGLGAPLSFVDPSRFNAVQVRVRRSSDQNGEVPMFFAQTLGVNTLPSQAVAVAAFADNFQGFKPPEPGGPNLPLLPITLDEQTWNALLSGLTDDDWKWNESAKSVTPGQDDVHEANLFPQGTGSPGNRGTVRIGRENNSTAELSQQIREGVSAADFAALGGNLSPGSDGAIHLGGDPGMSGGIANDLASIVGQTRIIPIFSTVSGNGSNAQYTIVHFAGVRIMAVNLTGNPTNRYVIIQPASITIDNGIPGSDDAPFSQYIYSKRVWLAR